MDIESLKYILAAVIAVIGGFIGNIVFYNWVKGRVDKDIERHKISYAGLFKERVDVYKECLKLIILVKFKINQFQHDSSTEKASELMLLINDMINTITYNRPFLSESVIEKFNSLKLELQGCFESFWKYDRIIGRQNLNSEMTDSVSEDY